MLRFILWCHAVCHAPFAAVRPVVYFALLQISSRCVRYRRLRVTPQIWLCCSRASRSKNVFTSMLTPLPPNLLLFRSRRLRDLRCGLLLASRNEDGQRGEEGVQVIDSDNDATVETAGLERATFDRRAQLPDRKAGAQRGFIQTNCNGNDGERWDRFQVAGLLIWEGVGVTPLCPLSPSTYGLVSCTAGFHALQLT